MDRAVYERAAAVVRKWIRRKPIDIEKFIEGVLRHGLTDRDLAHSEMRDLDVEAQLLAIKSLIGRNQQADEDLERKIKDLYEQARRAKEVKNGPYQDDLWVDETYQSFFQYAAHSMAAVGMLAPFTETLFTKFFPGLPREKMKNKQGIVKAIGTHSKSSSESRRLVRFFPEDYEETLDALFSYRNKMFTMDSYGRRMSAKSSKRGSKKWLAKELVCRNKLSRFS